jgi:pumilio RNA-binding family
MIPSLPEQLIGNLLHDEHPSYIENRNFQFANELERSYSAPPSTVQYGHQSTFFEAPRDFQFTSSFPHDFNSPTQFQRSPVIMPSWDQPVPMNGGYGRFNHNFDDDGYNQNYRQPMPKKGNDRKYAQTDEHINGAYGFGFSTGFESWPDKRGSEDMFYPNPNPRNAPRPMPMSPNYPEDVLAHKMGMMSLNGSGGYGTAPIGGGRNGYVQQTPDRNKLYHPSQDWYDYPEKQPQYNQMSNMQKVIGPGNRGAPINDYFPVMSPVYSDADSNEYESYPEYSPKTRYANVGSPRASTTSSVLEQFRNSKTSNLELRDIVGHFMEFSCDQHGSRFIQQKLEIAQSEKDLVFEEIYPEALRLMTDVFGNYVIQKFFEYGSQTQKRKLGDALRGHVLDLSLQMYGCRVVQKALEVIEPEQQIYLVTELEGHVLTCIKDQNGNHVIQKVIEHVDPEHTQFIVRTFIGKVFKLATHPYGCRVIQRILEQPGINDTTSTDSPTRLIVSELLHCTISLVQDQYGNYVVQHVLKYGLKEDKHEIISQLRGKIVQFSQHKFASNVIEQCVEYGTLEHCQWLIDEIIAEPRALEVMMKHQYANYVVQKTLEVCSSSQRDVLVEHIRPHISSLKKYTYGKHIIARMEKIQSSVY